MVMDVVFIPEEIKGRKASGVCVVVDVLRASSSIVTALANGCPGIHPVAEPSEAFPMANGSDILACGERDGVRIPGYHLGNSPAEFTREAVGGKRLVMCTTNGTRAVRAASGYRRIFIGSFLNAAAVASLLSRLRDDATIICAGQEGIFSIEDALCAGMILSEMKGEMTDAAAASVSIFDRNRDRIGEVLLNSQHGRFLRQIGFAPDVAYCARVGIAEIVPEVSPSGMPPPHDLIIRAKADANDSGKRCND